MANNDIQIIKSTDILASSMDTINSNFKILRNAIGSGNGFVSYDKYVKELLNKFKDELDELLGVYISIVDECDKKILTLENKITNDNSEIYSKIESIVTDVSALTEIETGITESDGDYILASLAEYVELTEQHKLAINTLKAEIEDEDGLIQSKLKQLVEKTNEYSLAINELRSAIEGSDGDIESTLTQLAEKTATLQKAQTNLSSSISNLDTKITSGLLLKAEKDDLNQTQTALAALDAQINDGDSSIKSQLNLISSKDYVTKSQMAKAILEAEIGASEGDEISSSLEVLATNIDGVKTAQTSLKSRVDGVESSITALTTKTDELSTAQATLSATIDEKVNAGISAYASSNNITGMQEAITAMSATIDGHSASIATCVSKTSDGVIESGVSIAADQINFTGKNINLSAASSIGLNADQINITTEHSLNISSAGELIIDTDNFKLDETGNVTVKGNVTANEFNANGQTLSDGGITYIRKSHIDEDEFTISSTPDGEESNINNTNYSEISISIMDIAEDDSDAGDLRGAVRVPTLCMIWNGKKFYLKPSTWKLETTSNDNTNMWWDYYTTIYTYGTISSTSGLINSLTPITSSGSYYVFSTEEESKAIGTGVSKGLFIFNYDDSVEAEIFPEDYELNVGETIGSGDASNYQDDPNGIRKVHITEGNCEKFAEYIVTSASGFKGISGSTSFSSYTQAYNILLNYFHTLVSNLFRKSYLSNNSSYGSVIYNNIDNFSKYSSTYGWKISADMMDNEIKESCFNSKIEEINPYNMDYDEDSISINNIQVKTSISNGNEGTTSKEYIVTFKYARNFDDGDMCYDITVSFEMYVKKDTSFSINANQTNDSKGYNNVLNDISTFIVNHNADVGTNKELETQLNTYEHTTGEISFNNIQYNPSGYLYDNVKFSISW